MESAAAAVLRSPVSSDSSDAPTPTVPSSNETSSRSFWSRFKDRLQDRDSPRAPKPVSPKVHGLDEFVHPEHGRPVPRSIGTNAALFHHDSKRVQHSSKLAKASQPPDERHSKPSTAAVTVSARRDSEHSSAVVHGQSPVRRVTSQQLPVTASARASRGSISSQHSATAQFSARQPLPIVAVSVAVVASGSPMLSSHPPQGRVPVANMAHISEVVSQESAVIPVAPARKPLIPLAPVEFMTPGELRWVVFLADLSAILSSY
jgi:hypothetical protein